MLNPQLFVLVRDLSTRFAQAGAISGICSARMTEQSNKMTERTGVMRPDARRERIEQMVRERERVTVDAGAELLGTSRETIRRDLTELAERGRGRRIPG